MKWRVIPSYPSYEASSTGLIRRRSTGRVRKLSLHNSGYLQVALWENGEEFNRYVQRLVCEAFHGRAPRPKMHASHRNGDKIDNRQSNLRWLTKKQNEHEKRRHGRTNTGSRNGMSVLTEKDVRAIKVAFKSLPLSSGGVRFKKGSLRALALRYGVTPFALYRISSGRGWTHL